ncbi:hypothetical protein [Candidatus Ichthyocystis hellenicum]|uniref:hypothetical protein n=1 Tax=Candidatus Ichthyocystis hellenicum TaxID=1561003 RepID=UPI001111B993|nr:hypothetical protein [Candidatus Ichthyocystis hellenicum]
MPPPDDGYDGTVPSVVFSGAQDIPTKNAHAISEMQEKTLCNFIILQKLMSNLWVIFSPMLSRSVFI